MMRPLMVILLLLPAVHLHAETAAAFITKQRDTAAESGPVAQQALTFLCRLATLDSSKHLGLLTNEDRDTAKLGTFQPIYVLTLDAIIGFQPSMDVTSMFEDTGRVTYPVITTGRSGSETKSAVEVARVGKVWRPASYGGRNFSRAVDAALAAADIDADEAILVEVPAFRLYFVAFARGEKLMFASISNAPSLRIERGAPRPAGDVILELKKPAQRHNRLPN